MAFFNKKILQDRDYKESVRAATTAAISGAVYSSSAGKKSRGQLTNMPNVIDGVSLITRNRVLVKDESAGVGADAHGIWKIANIGSGANGIWNRAEDFQKETDSNQPSMAIVFVQSGTTNAGVGFRLTTQGSITIGGSSGTDLTFEQFTDVAGGGGGGLFVMKGNFGVSPAQLRYADFTSVQSAEVAAQFAMPRDGTINGLSVRVFTNSLDDSAIVTVRVNGAPTVVTITVSAAATGFFTLSSASIAVSEGDLISVEFDLTAAASGSFNASKVALSVVQ